MNISSAQPSYSITSSDVITIDLSSITTTSTGAIGSITLNGSGTGYTIGTGIGTATSSTWNTGAGYTNVWKTPEEWVDCFPDWTRVEKMCEQYPGLKIAFDKFKTTYDLVKDDYDTSPEKRIKP